MGFMDKAKRMAEQAQAKLDEAQKQFNAPSTVPPGGGGGPAVAQDDHGRPIGSAPSPESTAPPPPPAPPTPPSGGADVEEDRNRPAYAPPKLSSGDPLSG